MKLHIAKSAPVGLEDTMGSNFCGDIASFSWYPGIYKVNTANLLALRYGFNMNSRYLDYRMDSFDSSTSTIIHDFSLERKYLTLAGSTYNWDTIERALKITGPTKILIPYIQFNE
jgi:hypothetical protein